jgi:hypothetical protein
MMLNLRAAEPYRSDRVHSNPAVLRKFFVLAKGVHRHLTGFSPETPVVWDHRDRSPEEP